MDFEATNAATQVTGVRWMVPGFVYDQPSAAGSYTYTVYVKARICSGCSLMLSEFSMPSTLILEEMKVGSLSWN